MQHLINRTPCGFVSCGQLFLCCGQWRRLSLLPLSVYGDWLVSVGNKVGSSFSCSPCVSLTYSCFVLFLKAHINNYLRENSSSKDVMAELLTTLQFEV